MTMGAVVIEISAGSRIERARLRIIPSWNFGRGGSRGRTFQESDLHPMIQLIRRDFWISILAIEIARFRPNGLQQLVAFVALRAFIYVGNRIGDLMPTAARVFEGKFDRIGYELECRFRLRFVPNIHKRLPTLFAMHQ